ncbi:DUF6615 family protein [Mesorhizobium sp. BHbsci]
MASNVQLCASFRREAGRVWKQMATARSMGLFVGEETITETCLYNIAIRHWKSSIAIIPASKPQETVHGADWEWWFTRKGRGVGYRVQAKRLFPSGRYQSLFKSGDKYGQLKTLVANAKADNLDALYCFYNFDHSNGLRGFTNGCPHSYRGPSFWGGAIALPEDVEQVGSNEIKDLRHIMRPWHSLVCLSSPGAHLPTSVLKNVRQMAAPRTVGPEKTGRREAIEVASSQRDLPKYVRRLIELDRSTRDAPPEERRYLDFAYWQEGLLSGGDVSEEGNLPGEGVAGLTVFDEE